jgi:hypothetical protein
MIRMGKKRFIRNADEIIFDNFTVKDFRNMKSGVEQAIKNVAISMNSWPDSVDLIAKKKSLEETLKKLDEWHLS